MSSNKYLKYKQKYLDLKKEQKGQRYKESLNLEGGSNTSLACSNGDYLQIGDCFYIDGILYPNCNSNVIFKISNMFQPKYLNYYNISLKGLKTSAEIHIDKINNIQFIPDILSFSNLQQITTDMIHKIDCPLEMPNWDEINRKKCFENIADLLKSNWNGTRNNKLESQNIETSRKKRTSLKTDSDTGKKSKPGN
jgi:hypothetical protein